MKIKFIKTKNVKQFIALMEELNHLPSNIPKIALVYGEHGLGKSETIKWWALKNDCVYVRATKGMTSRWLISEIAEELDEEPFWHLQENFLMIETKLKENPKTIIIDEVDFLIEKNIIETMRDIHDRTGCPLVLVGMGLIDRKLSRYPHFTDRIYKSFKFEKYNANDIKLILKELTDLNFTDDGINYLATRTNQLRQLIKLINKLETITKTNNIDILDEFIVKGILNGRENIANVQATKTILAS